MTESHTPGPSRKERVLRFVDGHFICLLAVAAVLSYAIIQLEHCFEDPIRADGDGYYAYLPALLIHGDPSFESVARTHYSGEIPSWTGLRKDPATGRYVDRYNIGLALMMLPFFLLAHATTWIMQSPGAFEWWKFNHPADGYSFFYQHAAGLAGVAYFIAGMAILLGLLRRYFSRDVTLATLGILLFGTNLYHYGTAETVFPTSYSFFLFCAFLQLTSAWYERPGDARTSALLGLVAGLICLVRLTNIVSLVVFPLYGVCSARDLGARVKLLLGHGRNAIIAAGVAVAVFIPQLCLWKYSSGHWLLYSYGDEGFHWSDPHPLNVLFHVKHGLFFYCPVLVLAAFGIPAMARRVPAFVSGGIAWFALSLSVIACWWNWWGGGSLGHRWFVEGYGLMALSIASFLASLQSRRERALVTIFCAAAILFFLFFMKLYYTREMPYEGLDTGALYDIFYARRDMIRGWFH